MTEITNQEIIDRYLKRFSHSKASQSMRKYCLQYFFNPKFFGYSGHIFNLTKRDVIDYFDYLNHLDTISLQTKQNKWMIKHSEELGIPKINNYRLSLIKEFIRQRISPKFATKIKNKVQEFLNLL